MGSILALNHKFFMLPKVEARPKGPSFGFFRHCATFFKKLFLKLNFQIFVTSTSQHQIFDEKFDQEPENVRIKMADLAGP